MAGYLSLRVDLKGLDRVEARVEAAEAALFEAGALSVTLTDAVDDAILEPAPGEVRLWPQTVLGASWAAILATSAPAMMPWAAPILGGLILAVPFCVLTAHPVFGRMLRWLGLCTIPEEFAPPAEVSQVCVGLGDDGSSCPLPAVVEFKPGMSGG